MRELMKQYVISCEQADVNDPVTRKNLAKVIIPALEQYAHELETTISKGRNATIIDRIQFLLGFKEKAAEDVMKFRNAAQSGRERIAMFEKDGDSNFSEPFIGVRFARSKPC